MNQSPINFNAKLIDNEIIIKLTSENGDSELANEAASKLFDSFEQIGIKVTREILEQDWRNRA